MKSLGRVRIPTRGRLFNQNLVIMRKPKTELSDFSFIPRGPGRYSVIYYSPVSSKRWAAIIEDMTLIDSTKGCLFTSQRPKQKDLDALKREVKRLSYKE